MHLIDSRCRLLGTFVPREAATRSAAHPRACMPSAWMVLLWSVCVPGSFFRVAPRRPGPLFRAAWRVCLRRGELATSFSWLSPTCAHAPASHTSDGGSARGWGTIWRAVSQWKHAE